jgi:PII-like signaling protein
MNKLAALRLYFHHSAKLEPRSVWDRLNARSIADHVLKTAHREGIEQVLVHQVHSGYLASDKPRVRHVEATHPRLPHCIELVDLESKLRQFWENHGEPLKQVRALFMQCEPATPELS